MTLTQFNSIIEIRTKIISMGTFITGSIYALTLGNWSWQTFIIMGSAVLCVDMATTGFNSYYDYLNGTDNRTYNQERDKVLVHDGVSPQTALSVSLALSAAAAVLGIILAYRTSWLLIPAGGICMIAGYAYTGGPWPISRTPLGDLAAGGFLGTALFMISVAVMTGEVTLDALAASLPLFCMIALILMVNNTCDIEGDTAAGRKTLEILIGKKRSIHLMGALGLGAYASAFALSLAGIYPFPVVPLLVLSLAFSAHTALAMKSRGFTMETKGPSIRGISRIFLTLVFALSCGMLISLLI